MVPNPSLRLAQPWTRIPNGYHVSHSKTQRHRHRRTQLFYQSINPTGNTLLHPKSGYDNSMRAPVFKDIVPAKSQPSRYSWLATATPKPSMASPSVESQCVSTEPLSKRLIPVKLQIIFSKGKTLALTPNSCWLTTLACLGNPIVVMYDNHLQQSISINI